MASSRDPLQVQIHVRAKLPRNVRPTRALVEAAIRYRCQHRRDHPNFAINIIRWRNPTRAQSKDSWRQGNQDDAWMSLCPALSVADIDIVGDVEPLARAPRRRARRSNKKGRTRK